MVEHAEGNITGASGDIEYVLRRRWVVRGEARVERVNKVVPAEENRLAKALQGSRRDCYTHFHMRCQPKDIRSFILSYDSATLWKTSATRAVFSASDRPSSNPKCVVLSVEFEVLLLFVAGLCAANDVLKVLAERMQEQEQEREGRNVRVAVRKTGRAGILATNKVLSVRSRAVFLVVCARSKCRVQAQSQITLYDSVAAIGFGALREI